MAFTNRSRGTDLTDSTQTHLYFVMACVMKWQTVPVIKAIMSIIRCILLHQWCRIYISPQTFKGFFHEMLINFEPNYLRRLHQWPSSKSIVWPGVCVDTMGYILREMAGNVRWSYAPRRWKMGESCLLIYVYVCCVYDEVLYFFHLFFVFIFRDVLVSCKRSHPQYLQGLLPQDDLLLLIPLFRIA